jgi:hypothetical protein
MVQAQESYKLLGRPDAMGNYLKGLEAVWTYHRTGRLPIDGYIGLFKAISYAACGNSVEMMISDLPNILLFIEYLSISED